MQVQQCDRLAAVWRRMQVKQSKTHFFVPSPSTRSVPCDSEPSQSSHRHVLKPQSPMNRRQGLALH